MIVAGLGCRRGCTAADLMAAVRLAECGAGQAAGALAAPRSKAHEAGLREAAAALGLPLLLVEDAAMQAMQPRCPTRSAAALAATGLASVAEAAALAGSGGRLVLPRVAVGGATCALAGPLLPPGLGREADQARREVGLAAEQGTAGAAQIKPCVGKGGASRLPHPGVGPPRGPSLEGKGEA